MNTFSRCVSGPGAADYYFFSSIFQSRSRQPPGKKKGVALVVKLASGAAFVVCMGTCRCMDSYMVDTAPLVQAASGLKTSFQGRTRHTVFLHDVL